MRKTQWIRNESIYCILRSKLRRSEQAFMLNEQQFYLFGQIQTSQTVGQLYSHTSP